MPMIIWVVWQKIKIKMAPILFKINSTLVLGSKKIRPDLNYIPFVFASNCQSDLVDNFRTVVGSSVYLLIWKSSQTVIYGLYL